MMNPIEKEEPDYKQDFYDQEEICYWREDCPACKGTGSFHTIYKYDLDEEVCFCDACHHHLTKYNISEKDYPDAEPEQKQLTTTKGEKVKNEANAIKPPTKEIVKQGILRQPPEKAGD